MSSVCVVFVLYAILYELCVCVCVCVCVLNTWIETRLASRNTGVRKGDAVGSKGRVAATTRKAATTT